MQTFVENPLGGQAESTVQYKLPIGDALWNVSNALGKKIKIEFGGAISCIACGVGIKKSFGQGYCYPCFNSLASCDMCIMKPELCHHAQGTCREPAWGEEHCMIPHTVYLANSSGVKVGITRTYQQNTRWMDQGAISALPIGTVQTRLDSGKVEVALKEFVSDKTNWRKMLKGEVDNIDLQSVRESLLEHWPQEIAGYLPKEEVRTFHYPVLEYPTKVVSHNLEKKPMLEGTLMGIKGQYLILDTAVINMRKYTGYTLELEQQE
jgi:hypothetical protein